jgi:hypothetical protein
MPEVIKVATHVYESIRQAELRRHARSDRLFTACGRPVTGTELTAQRARREVEPGSVVGSLAHDGVRGTMPTCKVCLQSIGASQQP